MEIRGAYIFLAAIPFPGKALTGKETIVAAFVSQRKIPFQINVASVNYSLKQKAGGQLMLSSGVGPSFDFY